VLGVASDITERKVAEQERAQLEVRLRQAQKMESIGQLAGGVAHDFNNLLTPILGYTEILLGRLAADDPACAELREIMSAAERARSLVAQLLAFGRKQLLETRLLDLNAELTETCRMLRFVIPSNIRIRLDLAPELGAICADPTQVQQIVMNLAVNARDAMPDGGELRFETRNVRPEGAPPQVQLTIGDTGCGMDAETQAKIFEPFFTTKERGQGTGLGLATVYGIVKQHGGDIGVDSAPGRGTTFRLCFPCAGEGPASHAEEGALPRPDAAGSETILVVEDEATVRRLITTLLRARGYSVLSAGEPLEALRLSAGHRGPVHLLLADMVMPQMTGRELYTRLASQRPETRVLYMSGYPQHGDPDLRFLQKPFSVRSLAEKLREILDGV
jgi:CheY-like chemotaxis protein